MEGSYLLDGTYKKRDMAIEKCARIAFGCNYKAFAIQNGGLCSTSCDAIDDYSKYGASNSCKADGKGGVNANNVYEITKAAKVRLKNLGCWKDTIHRAIPTMEKLHKVLDGKYWTRKEAIAKCVQAAYSCGYNVIALQNGGWCAASKTAGLTYKKYGKCNTCKAGGKGGPWANQVYKIVVVKEKINK
uniref:Uncharacterized protein LOC108950884 n=1 Tax=Phallusia mammillata TaxID=59560 RepID=A0A6F9DIR5_9ASCI|nr:uncharacterized protein LOC108950884 [Phallusia mammillata]